LFSLILLPVVFLSAIAQEKKDKAKDKEDPIEAVLQSMAEKPKEMGEIVSETLLKFVKKDHVAASFQDQEALKAALDTWVAGEIAAAGDSRTKLSELFHVLESKNEWPKILAADMKPWTAAPDTKRSPDAFSKGRLQDGPKLVEWTAAFLSEAEKHARRILSRKADDKDIAGGIYKREKQAVFGASGAGQEGAKKIGKISESVGNRIATDDVAGLYKERKLGHDADSGAGAVNGLGTGQSAPAA
jgi:hypothetical protein